MQSILLTADQLSRSATPDREQVSTESGCKHRNLLTFRVRYKK
jgi:hypothetical protein